MSLVSPVFSAFLHLHECLLQHQVWQKTGKYRADIRKKLWFPLSFALRKSEKVRQGEEGDEPKREGSEWSEWSGWTVISSNTIFLKCTIKRFWRRERNIVAVKVGGRESWMERTIRGGKRKEEEKDEGIWTDQEMDRVWDQCESVVLVTGELLVTVFLSQYFPSSFLS